MRRNKYNARKTTVCGHTFDSKKEAERDRVLLSKEQAGEISALTIHPRFEIMPKFKDRTGKTHRSINYVGDFEYIEEPDKTWVVEDVKGVQTQVFRIKKKLFLREYPGVDFRIVEKTNE